MRLQLHFYVLMRTSAYSYIYKQLHLSRKAVTLQPQQLLWMTDNSASSSLLLGDISSSSVPFFPLTKDLENNLLSFMWLFACLNTVLPLLILLFSHGVVPANLSYKYLRPPWKNKQVPVPHQNQELSGWVSKAQPLFVVITWAATGAQAPHLKIKLAAKFFL